MLPHPSDRRTWASTLSYPAQGSTFALSLCSDVAKVTFCPLCCRGTLNLPNKMHQSSSVTAIGILKSCLFARCLSLGQLAVMTACKWQVRIQISQTRRIEDKLIISDSWFTLPFPPVVTVPEHTLFLMRSLVFITDVEKQRSDDAVLWCSGNAANFGPLAKEKLLGIIHTRYTTPRNGISKQNLDFQPKIVQFLGVIKPHEKVFLNKIVRSPNFDTCCCFLSHVAVFLPVPVLAWTLSETVTASYDLWPLSSYTCFLLLSLFQQLPHMHSCCCLPQLFFNM